MQGDDAAAQKFQEVSKAYDTLRDPQKRQQYDQMGADGYERMAEAGGGGFNQVGSTAGHVIKHATNLQYSEHEVLSTGSRRSGISAQLFGTVLGCPVCLVTLEQQYSRIGSLLAVEELKG